MCAWVGVTGRQTGARLGQASPTQKVLYSQEHLGLYRAQGTSFRPNVVHDLREEGGGGG